MSSTRLHSPYCSDYAKPGRDRLLTVVGQKISSLPTPACIINRSKVENNCKAMLENVNRLGVSFRAHIKTHKTLEGTRLQLGDAGHGKIIVSTILEAYEALPLVQEGLITDILYGVPVSFSKLPALAELSRLVPHLRIMIDSEDQLEALTRYNEQSLGKHSWSLFVKVDCGYGRAGLPPFSKAFEDLVTRCLGSQSNADVEIYGFYSHAGQSYHDRNQVAAKTTFLQEIASVNKAASLAKSLAGNERECKFVLSVGATPTAHAFKSLTAAELPEINGELELHAGCYGICDLQQFATGMVDYNDIAIRVLGEVASKYKDRDEYLIDAGVLALSRETGPIPGFGDVEEPHSDWHVGRMSQEHGILTRKDDRQGSKAASLSYGDKVLIIPQHACITSACHQWYYVVDEDGLDAKIVDIWVRFNGW